MKRPGGGSSPINESEMWPDGTALPEQCCTLQSIVLHGAGRMTNSPTIGIRFTSEELELLDALTAKEERTRSDVVRRAVRAYAENLGVKAKAKKKAPVTR